MAREGDRFQIKGYSPAPRAGDTSGPGLSGRPWLSIWFNCCGAYARIYRNAAGSMYEGRCPRCGGRVRALVGPNGATRRVFETK